MNKRDQQLKFIQFLELMMLKSVVRACDNLGLTYYISGGTYLGAVRNKGFIPWDDDVDVALPRPDYEKLLDSLPTFLPNYYHIMSFSSVNGYYEMAARICDTRIYLELINYKTYTESPCWIDIFPLDGAPAPGFKRCLWKLKLSFYEVMWGLSRTELIPAARVARSKAKQFAVDMGRFLHVGKFMDAKKWCIRRENALKSCRFADSDFCLNAVGAYRFKSIFNKEEVYAEGASYEFEGLMLNGPKDYEKYLTQIYGNYLALPPEDKRNWHGTKLVQKKRFLIGYTQGVFDMFHIGHLNLLINAKAQCDFLIVGVNSDELVQSYKHKNPVINENERQTIVSNVKVVDECYIVSTLDKLSTWNEFHFDAIFIGDDWKGNERWAQTERDLEPFGVKVVYLPHTAGVSSTMLKPEYDSRVDE